MIEVTLACGRRCKVADKKGKRFGRLIVIEFHSLNKDGKAMWNCVCDCGNRTVVRATCLLGNTKSCGCLQKESRIATGKKTGPLRVTHGMSFSPEYSSWQHMVSRCNNSSGHAYWRYGGRGIRIFPPWVEDFSLFYDYIGERPPGKSLDRIDSDGDYWPGNVRWSTPKEQANNRRNNVMKVAA